jgi:hypothetical protein
MALHVPNPTPEPDHNNTRKKTKSSVSLQRWLSSKEFAEFVADLGTMHDIMAALSMPNIKLKWADHLNSSWSSENCDTIATREGIHLLYERLVANKVLLAD